MNLEAKNTKELKKIRTQAKAQVIIMVSSLILIFSWFSMFSWLFKQDTFSYQAFYEVGRFAAPLASDFNLVIPIIFLSTIAVTLIYIFILITFAPKLKHQKTNK